MSTTPFTQPEIIDLIRDRLGYNTSFSQDIILRSMNAVQKKYEFGHDQMPLPWFNFRGTEQVTATENISFTNLPTNFIAMDADWAPYIITNPGTDSAVLTVLKRESMSKLTFDLLETGKPTHYELADVIFWVPKPDATYQVYFPHYIGSDPLSTDTNSDWFKYFPNLIIEETASMIARNGRDRSFDHNQVQMWRDDYMRRTEQYKHQQKIYKMGSDV